MSSFSKNIIPRRAHKERSQPSSRIQKHGLLEKKKDYKLRAHDRNRKLARVKLMREKAAFRNPDEFYYGMINAKTTDGRVNRVVDPNTPQAVPLSNRSKDERLLVETSDSRYVTMKLAMERNQLANLRKTRHAFATPSHKKPSASHILFAEDAQEAEQIAQNRSSQQQREVQAPNPVPRKLLKQRARDAREFQRREERETKLQTVLRDIASTKNLLSKGRRLMVRPPDRETGSPAVFRWRQERSR